MFEHSLIELEDRPRSGRRWLSFPVAVLVHLVAFGAVGFGSYWSVGAVAEADLMDPYVIQLQLPETPQQQQARPATPPPAAPTPQAAPQQQQPLVQPDRVLPDLIPNAVDLPTAPSPDANPSSNPTPCSGCTGTDPDARGTDDSGPGDDADGGPMVLRAGMKPPVVVARVDPRYTESARKVGLQGVVIVEAVIDERGRVTNVKVLRGLPLGLEEAAVAAVKQWRFEPATTLDGHPVKVYYNLTINFRVLR
jgi:protein TonB